MPPLMEKPMIPLLQDLSGMVDDMSGYHTLEVLPNGDTIIHCSTDPLPNTDDDADP